MKKINFFILFIFIGVTLEANYCVQVLTTNKLEKNSIIHEAKNDDYRQFQDARVETRGNYLVFRIGDYGSYRDAKSDLLEIRKTQKEAYIRKCDIVQEKIVYASENISRVEVIVDSYYKKELNEKPKKLIVIPQKKRTQKPKYETKKELTYSSSKSLWGDCKKCFIPIYEQEDEEYVEPEVKREPKRKTREYKEIEVRVQEVEPSQESFWADDTVQKNNNRSARRKKTNNKFNIDEQFLP